MVNDADGVIITVAVAGCGIVTVVLVNEWEDKVELVVLVKPRYTLTVSFALAVGDSMEIVCDGDFRVVCVRCSVCVIVRVTGDFVFDNEGVSEVVLD